jgi:hypothetical protein
MDPDLFRYGYQNLPYSYVPGQQMPQMQNLPYYYDPNARQPMMQLLPDYMQRKQPIRPQDLWPFARHGAG